MTIRVLILCTCNSARSQMAEGLWNTYGNGGCEAVSAGSRPARFVHPLAIQTMAELGIDITGHRSKLIDEVTGQTFDLVVTVCDNAKEACPALPTVKQYLHWPIDDPTAVEGEIGKLLAFRRARDEIRSRIRAHLSGSSDSYCIVTLTEKTGLPTGVGTVEFVRANQTASDGFGPRQVGRRHCRS